MTPKEFLISYVKKFNSGDISSMISLYETEACFVSQAGEVVKGIDNVRQRLQSFINMNGKIDSKESNWSGSDQRYRSCKY